MMMGDFEEAVMDAMEWKAKCRELEAELAALKAKMSGVDERVVFEAAYLKANYPRVAAGELSAPPIFGRVGSMKFHGQAEGDYECSDVQTCWVIWQARAAIPMVIPNGYALVPAQPQSDAVQSNDGEVIELLAKLRQMVCATPQNDMDRSGVWISTNHPVIKRIDAMLGGGHE